VERRWFNDSCLSNLNWRYTPPWRSLISMTHIE
jgi:hypothetical protein